MKKAKIKIPGLFTKSYTEKQYKKKITGKLFVPADKELIESLFVSAPDPRKGEARYSINKERVSDKDTAKNLARIAKDIKNQKGRVNIPAIAAAFACVLILVLTLVVFRNQIARVVIVSSVQGMFGAKCDIARLDINPLDTHFTIEGLSVANRKQPMKNLFDVGHIEFYFNLLELTRGKFIAETVEITGVTWNTDRKVSGALPPAAEKKYQKKQKSSKPNPVQKKIDSELARIKSGVSVDSGIAAVKDQLDPAKYFEREKTALRTPAVVEEVKATVPALTQKWQAKASDVRTQADTVVADAKSVSQIRPETLKSVADVQAALAIVNKSGETLKSTRTYAESTASEIGTDDATVKALSAKAQNAIGTDSVRLAALASSVKSVNLASGSHLISGVFNTFIMNALGEYYPLLDKGITMVGELQSGSSQKKAVSMQKKSSAISRIHGRDFVFASDTLPRFAMRNIALSAKDDSISLVGEAGVKNVTNDQDALGKPLTFDASVTHGVMGEKITGTVDFRNSAAERLDTKFDVGGYHLAIDSGNTPGVPSLSGTVGSKGTLVLLPDGTVKVDTVMRISGAKMTISRFDPEYLYSLYTDVLSDIDVIDIDVHAVISPDHDIDLTVNTGVDEMVRASLQKSLARKGEEVKAEIKKYSDNWLSGQKSSFSDEIAKFDGVTSKVKSSLDDVKNSQKIIDAKKAELEKRVRDIADEATSAAKKKATTEIQKQAAADKIKKLF